MLIATLFRRKLVDNPAESICRSLDREVMHTAIAAMKLVSIAARASTDDGDYHGMVVPMLVRLLPLECRTYPLVIQRQTPLILDGESIATLHIFYASVELARTLVMIAKDVPAACDDRLLQTIVTAWRRVCRQAVTALEQMIALQSNFGATAHANARAEVAIQLRAVSDGEFADAGKIQHPDLQEHRKTPRLSTRLFGWIPVRGVEQPVLVRDITDGGCGFDIQVELHKGQELTLHLAGGRRLPGRVTWAHATSAGIEFDNALAANDPLLGIRRR